SFVH
ncbi:hypothetical protein D046_4889, partial [Vibrio parahaemolyticus V-223/04]